MNVVTANSTATDALHGLADGVDAQKVDAFLDQLMHLAERLGNVAYDLTNDHVLRLQSSNMVLEELEVERAKSILRMVCARLAVRCSEWANRSVSPYGDVVEFEMSPTKNIVEVRFENTTALQQVRIAIQSANGKLQ